MSKMTASMRDMVRLRCSISRPSPSRDRGRSEGVSATGAAGSPGRASRDGLAPDEDQPRRQDQRDAREGHPSGSSAKTSQPQNTDIGIAAYSIGATSAASDSR
jgi:hypothetical protein